MIINKTNFFYLNIRSNKNKNITPSLTAIFISVYQENDKEHRDKNKMAYNEMSLSHRYANMCLNYGWYLHDL